MNAAPTSNLVELRRLLAERFPNVRRGFAATPSGATVPTGVPALDALLHGGLHRGQLTELVGTGDGSGSAQIIHALLRSVAADGKFLALIDGMDSFDVDAVELDVLARLLWVRCTKADDAIEAADILLRDRNFPFVVLDLKLNPVAQLRKIPANVWHRFRRLQEQNGTTTLVVTPTQLVGGAHCRVRVESRLGLGALTDPPDEVLARLQFELLRAAENEEGDAIGHAG
jgi:RecA/RadA recombinase